MFPGINALLNQQHDPPSFIPRTLKDNTANIIYRDTDSLSIESGLNDESFYPPGVPSAQDRERWPPPGRLGRNHIEGLLFDRELD